MLSKLSFRSLSCLAVFLSGSYSIAQCTSGDNKPCFANNPDILNGRTSLLPDDDVALNGTFRQSGTQADLFSFGNYVFTKDSQFATANPSRLNGSNPGSNSIEISGQMFTQAAPQVVTAVSRASWISGGNAVVENSSIPIPEMKILEGSAQIYGTAGDFLGTGVNQMVILGTRADPPLENLISFQAIRAANPNDRASGFVVGNMSTGIVTVAKAFALTSGIFTDWVDGQPKPAAQIAVISNRPQQGFGLRLSLYEMNGNLDVTPGKFLNLKLPEGDVNVTSVAIAAGRFAGGTHDQIVIAYAPIGGFGDSVRIITVDFDPTGTPVQKASYDTKAQTQLPGQMYDAAVWLAKGRFDWFNSSDQVALTLATGGTSQSGSLTQVFSFDQRMTPIPGVPSPLTSDLPCHFGLSSGRFDRMQTNPSPPPAQSPDPTPQLSDVSTDCTASGKTFLNIYNVSGPTSQYAITRVESLEIVAKNSQGSPSSFDLIPVTSSIVPRQLAVSVAAGDLQGRSLLLGPPEKATVANHLQPDLVLGLPPMHVDWIPPAGSTTPQTLNVSVFPATFNTSYSFQSGQSSNVSRSGTTSYTVATKASVNEKISYGVPGIASAVAQSAQATADLHKNTVAKKFNTYSGQSIGFSTKTTFDDIVAATLSQLNIYSYRVLGQCVDSKDAPAAEGCSAGQRPVYIQFSAPDNITYIQAAEARNIEWYQPVQEPGNVLSYPANLQQLEADLGGGTGLNLLTPGNNTWDSQTATKVVANWTVGNGSSVTSGSTATHTFDISASISGSVGFDGFGAGVGTSFDYNNSNSISTLNQSTSTISSSQGITLNRGVGGGPISEGTYDYVGQSFIYGQTPPSGTIQSDATPNTAVQAQGHITAGHVVDVLSMGTIAAGNFWPQAYANFPDIALNHPQRWLQTEPSGANPQLVEFNCPVGYVWKQKDSSCQSQPEKPTPANVADNVFYQMKGLFVTPGNTYDGPQITKTTLGEKVNLHVRIYNYSLKNFAAGAKMHVQFYAQPWGIGQFASDPSDPTRFAQAIYIGEGTDSSNNALPVVPAYCNGAVGGSDPCIGSAVRNWEYAYTSWDTSKDGVKAGSQWVFWVVVWAETDNGSLVTETAGHGLGSLPTATFYSLADVPIEPYSNNVGYYNQVFTVFGPTNVSAPAPGAEIKPSLILSNVKLRNGGKALRAKPVTITAKLRSLGSEVYSALVLYYDGNPDRDGVLFDMQSLDRIPLGDGVVDTARFSPKTCGPHMIYVRAIPLDGSIPSVTIPTSFGVTVDPVLRVESLITYVRTMAVSSGLKQQLLVPLLAAQTAYEAGQPVLGNIQIETFKIAVQIARKEIPDDAEAVLKEEIKDLQDCL